MKQQKNTEIRSRNTNKYLYTVILEQHNGNGWDELEIFITNSTYQLSEHDKEELIYLKGEYKLAQPGAALRTKRSKFLH